MVPEMQFRQSWGRGFRSGQPFFNRISAHAALSVWPVQSFERRCLDQRAEKVVVTFRRTVGRYRISLCTESAELAYRDSRAVASDQLSPAGTSLYGPCYDEQGTPVAAPNIGLCPDITEVLPDRTM
jgi:hypothetical protein